MNNQNIVIAALARDCEDSLRANIPVIEELRTKFLWSQVVVVENDSIDGTKELLNEWKIIYDKVNIISKEKWNVERLNILSECGNIGITTDGSHTQVAKYFSSSFIVS